MTRRQVLFLLLAKFDRLAEALGGHGRVLHNGRLLHSWGTQDQLFDWLSSAKPVLSTLLFYAVEEGKLASVDQSIADFGWRLSDKDRAITFRHLANMTSGYARPDVPGSAWAYNDYAIMLYQRTLFDRVFAGDADFVANTRFSPLGIEDGLRFNDRRRLFASVRDFARIAQFWLERRGRLKPYLDRFCKPQVPAGLPHTKKAPTDDYLGIGTYGGGSDHFTDFGAGTYGFNWWFNMTGRLHPDAIAWPDAPRDTFMSIGAGGNCAVVIPSRKLVLACARGQWGKHEPGNPASPTNQHIKLLLELL